VEASERRTIPDSVKSSCPFTCDPRRRRSRLRSRPFILNGTGPAWGWVPLDSTTSHLSTQPDLPGAQQQTSKEAKWGGLSTSSSLRAKGSWAPSPPPRKFPLNLYAGLYMPELPSGPALALRPCTCDNDGRTRRLPPGGTRDGAGAVCKLEGTERRFPSGYKKNRPRRGRFSCRASQNRA
jgi:hypothetical protein